MTTRQMGPDSQHGAGNAQGRRNTAQSYAA